MWITFSSAKQSEDNADRNYFHDMGDRNGKNKRVHFFRLVSSHILKVLIFPVDSVFCVSPRGSAANNLSVLRASVVN